MKMKIRTSHQMEKDDARTLYIRLPHSIKNIDEIRDLFVGDVKIKLPRQTSRHCRVVFETIQEKIKNLKLLKNKRIANKHIIVKNVSTPLMKIPNKTKVGKIVPKLSEKKPKIEPAPIITRTLHVSKIPKEAKLSEVKDAFPDCQTLSWISKTNNTTKTAMVRLKDVNIAAEYLMKKRTLPLVHGSQVDVKPDIRTRNDSKKTEELKFYDGDEDITSKIQFKSKSEKSVKKRESPLIKSEIESDVGEDITNKVQIKNNKKRKAAKKVESSPVESEDEIDEENDITNKVQVKVNKKKKAAEKVESPAVESEEEIDEEQEEDEEEEEEEDESSAGNSDVSED